MKTKWLISILAVILVAGCSGTGNEDKQKETTGKATSPDNTAAPAKEKGQENADKPGGEDQKKPNETAAGEEQTNPDGPAIDKEQKEMALNTLRELVKEAKEGKVYKQEEFYVGKTTKEDVHKRIGDPEISENGYDRYNGSMGNPSMAFSYDEKGVMKEARYFGTQVERQTNLGGIAIKDLEEQLGEPEEIRKIEATGEKNYVYHVGDYELQFIIGDNGTPDHVNLKGWK